MIKYILTLISIICIFILVLISNAYSQTSYSYGVIFNKDVCYSNIWEDSSGTTYDINGGVFILLERALQVAKDFDGTVIKYPNGDYVRLIRFVKHVNNCQV